MYSTRPRVEAAATPSQAGSSALGFAEVFREHAPFLIGFLRRLGVREADVQDLAQDVFVAVHRQLPAFRGQSSLRTWICGIAVRVVANHRRRAYNRRERVVGLVLGFGEPSPPTQLAALTEKEDRSAVFRALDTLDMKQREVFVLYEVEELDMADVARILGCPLFTAYSRLRTARKALRAALERRGYRRGSGRG